MIEVNIDDATPESLGYAMERLFAAGALDVYFTPIQMKKNRPGSMLSVICPISGETDMASLVIRETSTLGVRISRTRRMTATRRFDEVETPYGPVRVKVRIFAGTERPSPEYEDCAAIARERNLPISMVMQLAVEAWSRSRP